MSEPLDLSTWPPMPEQSDAAFKAHLEAIERAHADIGATEPSPERLVAIRTDLIRLCHSDSGSPERVVVRADAYLSFILNGTPKESIVDGED